MSLLFNWREIAEQYRGLTFDDVLIVPSRSDVRSRRQPDLDTEIVKGINKKIPLISANMDTITEAEMAIAMDKLGGFGILHRFMSVEDQVQNIHKVKEAGVQTIGASIGVNSDWKERSDALISAGANVLTIDIAHGHSIAMIDTLKHLKDSFPDVKIIAGNIATPEGAYDLISAGADAVKVGIGPGSMCTTRVITGCGVPQLTAIALCAQVTTEHKVPLIADGGLRTSGDIVKALAAGADCVMLGSMLSGTIETPGEIKKGQKQYRGMASKSAQVSWRGELPEGMAPEGESTFVSVKGHVADVIHEISGGIRSGMSYLNSLSVKEIRQNARFIETSSNGVRESRAHGVGLTH